MALETGDFIDDLVLTNPVSNTDLVRQGAGHLRQIKRSVRLSFAGSEGAILVSGLDAGTANAVVLGPTPALTEYSNRMLILWRQTVANTGAATIKISALPVIDLVSVSGAALTSGDLVVGHVYVAVYDSSSGDARLMAVTKNYVDQLAFQTALPSQPGTATEYYLRTLNGVASWETLILHSLDRRAITATDTVGTADIGAVIDVTSGTFTLAFAAAATLGDKATGFIQNSGTGDVTLDPNGAETIDGLASWVLYPGMIVRWYVEGSAIRTILIKGGYKIFTSTGTWTKSPGVSRVTPYLTGAGAGGGSGMKGSSGSDRSGGGGGSGGAVATHSYPASILAATETVTVGAKGTGGASVTTNSTNGNNGTAGGATTFGAWLRARGGNAGPGGQPSGSSSTASGATGFPEGGSFNAPQAGAGSGSPTTVQATTNAPGSGAGGGSRLSSNTTVAGAAGSTVGSASSTASGHATVIAGGAAGAVATNAGSGNAAPTGSLLGGSGGGGGGSDNGSTKGGNGGAGGFPGGGGGGGGSGTDGVNSHSGAGGDGADGLAIIFME